MSCVTLVLQSAAMATTQLFETTHYQTPASEQMGLITERKQPLKMSWVVVTGENGRRQLRMHWDLNDSSQ